MCEEDELYSTRIQKPGTGNAILMREGVSYNLLEWGCWEDMILTAIVFQDFNRINSQVTHSGVIIMSIYRRHSVKTQEFYKMLKKKVKLINERY